MRDTVTTVQIWVEFGIAIACLVLGMRIWFILFEALHQARGLPYPALWSIGATTLFNLAHFCWGVFHTEETISDLPSGGITLASRYADFWLFGLRILAIILIGTSVHLQKAIELIQAEDEEES